MTAPPQTVRMGRAADLPHDAHVAIVRLSALGDVILALPALEALHAERPGWRITWITESAGAAILEAHPALERVIEFPRHALKGLTRPGRGLSGHLRSLGAFRRELRAARFDLALDLQGNLKSAVVSRLTGAPLRAGLPPSHTREPNTWATHLQATLPLEPIHRSEVDLSVVRSVGLRAAWRPGRVASDAASEKRIDSWLADQPEDRPLIVLQPGTSAHMPHKRWKPHSWSTLATLLAGNLGAHIVWNGGPGEEALLDACDPDSRHARVPPEASLRELAALLSRADLLIGGDTGPTHLAEVLGRPTLTLLGPTDPRVYYPYGHPERALFRRLSCAPCRFRGCPARACMSGITPEEVAREAGRVLAEEGAVRSP